jgi:hypothetical protein
MRPMYDYTDVSRNERETMTDSSLTDSSQGNDGPEDAWKEPGSDELMTFETLVQIRAEAQLIEAQRARRVERRGE